MDSGCILLMPKRDNHGRQLVVIRVGKLPIDKINKNDFIHNMVVMIETALCDEKTQVHGFVLMVDFSDYSTKNQRFLTIDDRRKMLNIWQKNLPARLKELHMYNMGNFAEFILTVIRMALTEKMKKRFHIHGEMLESVYKMVDKAFLPEEYLPDDYTGPSAGPISDITENMMKKLKDPTIAAYLRMLFNPEYGIDESKRLDDVPSESFTQLNVD